jgi:hypothetical protein
LDQLQLSLNVQDCGKTSLLDFVEENSARPFAKAMNFFLVSPNYMQPLRKSAPETPTNLCFHCPFTRDVWTQSHN